MTDRPQLTEAEATALFADLFPHGWAGPDVLAELAPDGWAASPLAAVFHPSVDRQYEEAVQVHRNMANLPFRKPDAPPPPPAPTREEIAAQHQDTPIDPARECQELVGVCLWDTFSDNHEVTTADGRLVELGSHRAAGGFLAEVLNAQGGPPPLPRPDMSDMFDQMFPTPAGGTDPNVLAMMAQMRKEMVGDGRYTYLDFYMGSRMQAGRANLGPVFELIFRRMRTAGLDWAYTFPRLYAMDLRPLKKELDEREKGDEPEWSGYDPSAAFEAAAEEREQDEKLADLREELDAGHREAVAAAREQEPPTVVRAYRAVYGELPTGWPPVAE